MNEDASVSITKIKWRDNQGVCQRESATWNEVDAYVSERRQHVADKCLVCILLAALAESISSRGKPQRLLYVAHEAPWRHLPAGDAARDLAQERGKAAARAWPVAARQLRGDGHLLERDGEQGLQRRVHEARLANVWKSHKRRRR